MPPPPHVTIGHVTSCWAQHSDELVQFGYKCEAASGGKVTLQLTDDNYIGKACYRVTGSVRDLDEATFAAWRKLCPWVCTFSPSHCGYPCVFVDISTARPRGTDAHQWARILLVPVTIILSSWWVASQTPPWFIGEQFHDVVSFLSRNCMLCSSTGLSFL